MIIVAATLLALLSVPLAGGRLGRLAAVEVRHGWTVAVAVAVQFLVMSVLPEQIGALGGALHLASYGFGGFFLWANRRIPGLWLIAAGGLANFAAIAVNGGVMPASASAFESAGLPAGNGAFSNSAVLDDVRLAVLGDIFAIPASLPLSNVFSLGDVCVVIGLTVVLHALTGSRLVPSGKGDFVALARRPVFLRVWAAQIVSNLGDFAYSLAVAVTIIERGDGAGTLATVLIVQAAPAIVMSIAGGPLVDRLSRKRLMVGADVLRALAVGSLLVSEPTTVHILVVAACLGTFGALFQPALHASLPNLVPARLLVAANAVVAATFHIAVLVGPVLGGLLASQAGVGWAFAANAVSFALSAMLLLTLRIPQVADSRGGVGLGAIRDGLRFAVQTRIVRVIFAVTAGAAFAAALKQPLEPLFVLRTLDGVATDIGIATGAWGLGMVVGAASAPAAARRWSRERLTSAGLVGMGVAVLLASQVQAVSTLALLWLLGGAGNGVMSVAYETLIQERTPDRIRGRIVAAGDAMFDAGVVGGLLLAGAASAAFGFRGTMAVAGAGLLLSAFVALVWLRPPPALDSASPGPRFVPSLVEHVLVGDRALLRVAGQWLGAGPHERGHLALRVGERDVPALPDPSVQAADPPPEDWRAAFALQRGELQRLDDHLCLILGDAVVRLPLSRERAPFLAAGSP